jgi:hypothetical protein
MGLPTFTIYSPENAHVSNVSASILLNTDEKFEEYLCKNIIIYYKKILTKCKYILNEKKKSFKDFLELEKKIRDENRNKFLNLMDPPNFMKRFEKSIEKIIEDQSSSPEIQKGIK